MKTKEFIHFSLSLSIFVLLIKHANSTNKINWENVKPNLCVEDVGYERPSSAVNVSILLTIPALYDISEKDMEYGLQVQLMEVWEDPMLNITGVNIAKYRHEIMPSYMDKCIWKPDTIFLNTKRSSLYVHTLNNIFTALIEFYGNTSVMRIGRYMLVVSCNMNFHLYPMDSQYCSLEIGLLASKTTEIQLSWLRDSLGVVYENKIKPLNFKITLLDTNVTINTELAKETLYANFVFERALMASIMNTYVPSFLVVCLSFVSFWLDVEAVPGRITLGVTAILTLATSIVQVRGSLPVLDYMTAMDVWLLACMISVFLSLIEFTLAQSWSRNSLKRYRCTEYSKILLREKTNSSNVKIQPAWPDATASNADNVNKKEPVKTSTEQTPMPICALKKDNWWDRVSRVLFPLGFICFTVVYWVYFTSVAYPYSAPKI